MSSHIKLGDCVEKMRLLDENSVDSVVCDPPYGLKFMGKEFDNIGEAAAQREWHKTWAIEALRVLKPGGHMLAFGGSRTYHHLASAIEEAGFEIRDQIMWIYGSGFPKSTNITKTLDKNGIDGSEYEGYGTALKPAHEPIVLARKPFKGATYKNVLEHGTGALNIDGCRVAGTKPVMVRTETVVAANAMAGESTGATSTGETTTEGRWPANLILGHNEDCELVGTTEGEGYSINTFDNGAKPFGDAVGEDYSTSKKTEVIEEWECTEGCAIKILDDQTGVSKSPSTYVRKEGSKQNIGHTPGSEGGNQTVSLNYGDSGGASRFFYSTKANKKEKNAGLTKEVENDRFQTRECTQCGKNVPYVGSCGCPDAEIIMVASKPTKNVHPTVKPIDLMRYLVRLVTPRGGTTLDPFLGSGSTGIAAHLEGFNFIGIEKDEEYLELAKERIDWWAQFEGETKQILKDNK